MVYDTQCEPSRAKWLLELLTEEQEKELCERLAETIPRTRRRQNLYQHSELCLLLAQKGYKAAKRALYSAFQIDRYGDPIAADEILQLDGAEGLISICKVCLASLDRTELEYLVESCVRDYDEHYGEGEAERVITQNDSLKPLWHLFDPDPTPRHQHPRPRQHSKKTARKLTVSGILELLDSNAAAYYIRPVTFWRDSASEEQLEEMSRILAKENSVHRLRHILSVFAKRPIPQFDRYAEDILRLAQHDDWHVKYRTNFALSHIAHPMVRAQTLRNLAAQDWLVGELLPLKSNLQPGDSNLLAASLKVDRNDYRHHRLIHDLVEICQAHPWPEMSEVMHFVYQTSPCVSCRRWVQEVMLEQKLLPDWIADEWTYDASLRWDD